MRAERRGSGARLEQRPELLTACAQPHQRSPPAPASPWAHPALLNGTAVMTGIAACVVEDMTYLLELALGAAALSVEALKSSPGAPLCWRCTRAVACRLRLRSWPTAAAAEPHAAARSCFSPPWCRLLRRGDSAKLHPGQAAVARTLRTLLQGSRLALRLDSIRSQLEGAEAEALRRHDVVCAGVSIQGCDGPGEVGGAWRGGGQRLACVPACCAVHLPAAACARLRLALRPFPRPAAAPARCAASRRGWGLRQRRSRRRG